VPLALIAAGTATCALLAPVPASVDDVSFLLSPHAATVSAAARTAARVAGSLLNVRVIDVLLADR